MTIQEAFSGVFLKSGGFEEVSQIFREICKFIWAETLIENSKILKAAGMQNLRSIEIL